MTASCGITNEQPALADAVDAIRQDADYFLYLPWDAAVDHGRLREFVLAVAAMNYVQARISSTRYGYIVAVNPGPLPASDQEALTRGAGLCGNQVSAFLHIATLLGLEARSLEFYWMPQSGVPLSHIAAEVRIGGRWAYFDVTWGSYFRRAAATTDQHAFLDVLSYDGVKALADRPRHLVCNQANLALQLQRMNGIDPFDYMDKPASCLIGKQGSVTLPDPKQDGAAWIYDPTGMPNYIGSSADYATGRFGNTSIVLVSPSRVSCGTIRVTWYGCSESGALNVRAKGRDRFVRLPQSHRGDIVFDLPADMAAGDGITLSFASAHNRNGSHLVFKDITLR